MIISIASDHAGFEQKQLLAVYNRGHIIGIHAHIKPAARKYIFFLLGNTGKLL